VLASAKIVDGLISGEPIRQPVSAAQPAPQVMTAA
jgi:hypothetical protein